MREALIIESRKMHISLSSNKAYSNMANTKTFSFHIVHIFSQILTINVNNEIVNNDFYIYQLKELKRNVDQGILLLQIK
jgi:hypothetical protein